METPILVWEWYPPLIWFVFSILQNNRIHYTYTQLIVPKHGPQCFSNQNLLCIQNYVVIGQCDYGLTVQSCNRAKVTPLPCVTTKNAQSFTYLPTAGFLRTRKKERQKSPCMVQCFFIIVFSQWFALTLEGEVLFSPEPASFALVAQDSPPNMPLCMIAGRTHTHTPNVLRSPNQSTQTTQR